MNERFKVDLRGVIDLLANHLYTSAEVFVRELLQNAVDAHTARRSIDPSHEGRVTIELIPGQSDPASEAIPATICVRDNGIGLTEAEMHDLLSTIGASSKREHIEEMEGGSFLGRFGIGLLSCFMVTDEIVVISRSARGEHAGVEWRGRNDGSYGVRPLGADIAVGTQVFLRCKSNAEEYYEVERLIDLARRYGEMLSIPIDVCSGDRAVAVNRTPPWEIGLDDEGRAELDAYAEQALGLKPMDIFALHCESGAVRGHAFVTAQPANSARFGSDSGHRVYLRGMFLQESGQGLIPKWATFARFVVNADGLHPTASRESLHHDKVLEQASDELGKSVRAYLYRLMRREPAMLDTILAVHDTAIRGLARDDEEFFAMIIDLLRFETNMGHVRFGEFRREGERLLIARTSEQFRRVATVASAQGLRVFNAGYTHHEELLVKAAGKFEHLECRAFDASNLIDELPPASRSDEDLGARLMDAARAVLGSLSCEPVMKRFQPETAHCVFGLGLDAEFHRQVDRTKSIAAGHWKPILDAMVPRPDDAPPTRLAINIANPVVRRLMGLSDESLLADTIELLYLQTLLDGMYPLTGAESDALNRGLSRLIERAAAGSAR